MYGVGRWGSSTVGEILRKQNPFFFNNFTSIPNLIFFDFTCTYSIVTDFLVRISRKNLDKTVKSMDIQFSGRIKNFAIGAIPKQARRRGVDKMPMLLHI